MNSPLLDHRDQRGALCRLCSAAALGLVIHSRSGVVAGDEPGVPLPESGVPMYVRAGMPPDRPPESVGVSPSLTGEPGGSDWPREDAEVCDRGEDPCRLACLPERPP